MNTKSYMYFLKHILPVAICFAVFVKSVYKVLGYGTPLTTFQFSMYLITAVVFCIGIPIYIYKVFFKRPWI